MNGNIVTQGVKKYGSGTVGAGLIAYAMTPVAGNHEVLLVVVGAVLVAINSILERLPDIFRAARSGENDADKARNLDPPTPG